MAHLRSATGQARDCSPELKRLAAALLLLFCAGSATAQITLTQGTNFSIDAANDGRLAIDLLGAIWIVPASGGLAEAIPAGLLPARRPRWSPSAQSILYQVRATDHNQLWEFRFDSNGASNISDGKYFDQDPDWHPDGRRIVYSSDRRDTGFDLWELDLSTRLTWRISAMDGDELEPAWSADGRDLTYIHRGENKWSVMLRRHGQPDRILVASRSRLSAPQWRPDGSLITFLRHDDDNLSIDMAILAEPVLVRPLVTGEDFFVAPIAWLNRQQFVYPANGVIRKRNFNSWTATTLPFRATVSGTEPGAATTHRLRELPMLDVPTGRLIVRTARLFDGIGGGYQQDMDIIIEAGRIVALEPHRDRPGAIIIDMGDWTALPGFVDSYGAIPAAADETLGPLMLSFGVTTIVAQHAALEKLNQAWSGKAMPGPRLLESADIADTRSDQPPPWLVTISGDLAAGTENRSNVAKWQKSGVPVLAANWQVGLGSGATMLLGAESLPTSPGGNRYADIQLANGAIPVTIVSGLADINTTGLSELLRSRQAQLLSSTPTLSRRFSHRPKLASDTTSIVLGSRPNGLPPGIAQHAEFRALADAGLAGEQVLRASGVNAAAALGLGLQLGRLAPGSVADLVIVDGDPLANVADLQKVVAVVRNGRFFSAIGLIERARDAESVD